MATMAGSVVHRITEALDMARVGVMTLDPTDPNEWRRDPLGVAERVLDDEIKRALDRSDGVYTAKDIRISGRATKEWPKGQDRAFMIAHIPAWVNNWTNWLNDAPWQIWIAEDGQPGIELGLTFKVGNQEVRGSIDRVLVNGQGELAIVDLKAGSWVPKDVTQPELYAYGLQQKFPETRSQRLQGGFFMNRKAMIEGWSYLEPNEALLTHKYDTTAAKAEQGLLTWDTEQCEHMCSLRDHCPIYGGKYAISEDELLQGIRDAAQKVRDGEDMGSLFTEPPVVATGEAMPDSPPF